MVIFDLESCDSLKADERGRTEEEKKKKLGLVENKEE